MRRLRTALALALTTVLIGACSSSDHQSMPSRGVPSDRRRPDGADRATRIRDAQRDALDRLTESQWWRDDGVVAAGAVTPDQISSLDKIYDQQGGEIVKLERDSGVAQQELRQVIDGDKPSTSDIAAAGARVREIRGAMFDRQVRLLADERVLFSQQQWHDLQQALFSRNRNEDDGRGSRRGRMGGRGGMGGGRRPGRS